MHEKTEMAYLILYLLHACSVSGDRIYLNFENVVHSNWGFDGSTF